MKRFKLIKTGKSYAAPGLKSLTVKRWLRRNYYSVYIALLGVELNTRVETFLTRKFDDAITRLAIKNITEKSELAGVPGINELLNDGFTEVVGTYSA